ncbi:MAG: SCO family protein [Bordetella sp.]|nr:MAG: SCO family protein [Bordetella sp.]
MKNISLNTIFLYLIKIIKNLTRIFLKKQYLFLLICVLFISCNGNKDRWNLYNVEGHLPNLNFSLEKSGGEIITQKKFEGKIVLLFFGYTNCPDICPTTMAQLTSVLDQLGKEKSKDISILFVSVDPYRDKSNNLQNYLNSFNKDIMGLTGNEHQISSLAKRYRVAYQIDKPIDKNIETMGSDSYDITHSRGIYIFDRKGKARLLASNTDSIKIVKDDLLKLINE